MKLNNLRAFEKHCKEACTLAPLPVYLLVSKEGDKRRKAWESLRPALIGAENPELCLKVFLAEKSSPAQLNAELQSLPFFQKRQLVYIEQADKLTQAATETLTDYLRQPTPGVILIISAGALRSTSRLYKACEKEGLILDIPVQKAWEQEREMREWLLEAVKRCGKSLAPEVAQALVKHCGTQQELLEQEVQKLLCYVAERPSISLKDCHELGIDSFQESIWELGSAIFRKETSHALQIAEGLLSQGTALPQLLRQLRSQFQTEFQVCCILQNGGSSKDIMKAFPYMKGRILEQHMLLAKNYGMQRFRRGILAIDAADLKSKNSDISNTVSISLLLSRLTS